MDYGVDYLFNLSDREDGVGSLRYTQTVLWDPVPVHADGALSAGQADASNTLRVSSVDVAPRLRGLLRDDLGGLHLDGHPKPTEFPFPESEGQVGL